MMAKVPNLAECQPRFIAYCKAHGLHEGDEWKSYEYINWINRKAAEYKRSIRKSYHDILTPVEHEEFTRFLETESVK